MDYTGLVNIDQLTTAQNTSSLRWNCATLSLSELDTSISSVSDAMDRLIKDYEDLKDALTTYRNIFLNDIDNLQTAWTTIENVDTNATNILQQQFPQLPNWNVPNTGVPSGNLPNNFTIPGIEK